MKDWQTLFEVNQELQRTDTGPNNFIIKRTYYVYLKSTGEKVFPDSRSHGYSSERDAKRAAAHIYRNHMKTMEKELLT